MKAPLPSFAAIEMAAREVLVEMKARGIRLQRSELVTTSEAWDRNLSVWFFFQSDADDATYEANGTTQQICKAFFTTLESAKTVFPFSEIPNVSFIFDSHENVVRNFKGSYFLRLR